jgi:peptide/nickel transport system permease protein
MLTLLAFALLMLQSSLDEVFNPRLRRHTRNARRRRATRSAAVAPVKRPVPEGAVE